MTVVVNLFAGPGTGKSTTTAGLFYRAKMAGLNAEMAHEFAKDLVWEERFKTLSFQEYVAAKQIHRVERLQGKVDLVFTDSPVLFGLVYGRQPEEIPVDDETLYNRVIAWRNYILGVHKSWETINVMLTRDPDRAYSSAGRTQGSIEEAALVDARIEQTMKMVGVPLIKVQVDSKTDRHLNAIEALYTMALRAGGAV